MSPTHISLYLLWRYDAVYCYRRLFTLLQRIYVTKHDLHKWNGYFCICLELTVVWHDVKPHPTVCTSTETNIDHPTAFSGLNPRLHRSSQTPPFSLYTHAHTHTHTHTLSLSLHARAHTHSLSLSTRMRT